MGQVTTSEGLASLGRAMGNAGAGFLRARNQSTENDRKYQIALFQAKREQEEQQAVHQATRMRTVDMANEALAGAQRDMGIEEPRGMGMAPNPATAETNRFLQISEFASKLPAEHRNRFLAEEGMRLEKAAKKRARMEVMDLTQDRVARGGFNFLDEKEMNPVIQEKLDFVAKLADGDEVDPMDLQASIEEIADIVRGENKERLKIQRGDKRLDDELGRALMGGSISQAEAIEDIKVLWGSRELDFEDLEDRLFEARTGRKTQRAAGPTPYELREQAVKLYLSQQTGGIPTEEELQAIEGILAPPGTRAGESEQLRQRVGNPQFIDNQALLQQTLVDRFRGGEHSPRPEFVNGVGVNGEPQPAGPVQQAPVQAAPDFPRETPEAPMGPQKGPVGAKPKKKGKKPAPVKWEVLGEPDRMGAVQAMVKGLQQGQPAAEIAKKMGLDIESLPEEVFEAILQELGVGSEAPAQPQAADPRNPLPQGS